MLGNSRPHRLEGLSKSGQQSNGMNRRMWQYKFTAERAAQLKKLLIAGKLTLDVLLMSFGWLALWTDRQSAQWAFAMYLMYH